MTAPAVHKTASRKREIRAEHTASVAHAIGDVQHGCEVFILTHGQFSLIDALVYLSEQIGPCRLSVATWTAGNEDLQAMAGFLGTGRFTSVRWLVDTSFLNRQPAYCARLRELFGDDVIRTTRVHAKFVTMRNEQFDLAIRTSMNLNQNPRMENIEISDDRSLAEFLDGQMDVYFRDQAPGVFQAELRRERHIVKAGRVTARKIFS